MSSKDIRLYTVFFARQVSATIVFAGITAVSAFAQVSVTTYHYDNQRTGWNSQETTLSPTSVGGKAFGVRNIIELDGQSDAQPLVMPNITVTAGQYPGKHDVVYVVTSVNTVYAIDVHSGAILLHPNFGAPVTMPLGCNNNAKNVGITSTPVIDSATGTLYVMVYNQDADGPVYRLHALDLGNLTDKVTPRVVAASHALIDGTITRFNASVQRQRPGLLLANGSIYAGFGSFCDSAANLSRGWLLGWSAGSLSPLSANQLNDTQASSPNMFFLSAIWMSGYAPAADHAGNILFVTGNSDPSGTTYDGVTNIQESVVKITSSLDRVVDLFTPSNQATLDQGDVDFGSGGVLVLPDQPGPTPHLAVAAGKNGQMYLMNEDSLGGYSTERNNVLGTYPIGPCWCGQSFFTGPDGLGRVVSSGGTSVGIWLVTTSSKPRLNRIGVSPAISGGQNPGFFTSVSSNGTSAHIVWALSHPSSPTSPSISLYAFDPQNDMSQIYQAVAGVWPSYTGNSNLVPVVANGQVFVASNRQLQIFGLASSDQ
jgi:hypothetical protein